jgi:hypothetical protein
MKIDISESDIIKMIKENHKDDIDFLLEVIDEATTNYTIYKQLVKKQLEHLKEKGYLGELIEELTPDIEIKEE